MAPGEIYLANFPFGGSSVSKLRPALLLTGPLGTVPELLVAYISSVLPSSLLPTDILIDPHRPDFASTNLKAVSVLRLHKLATIHERMLARFLGKITSNCQIDLENKLRLMLRL